MAKQKIIAGHLDHKHGYYYMVLSLPNPEKGNRKLPKWFPTGIPYDGKRQTERDAKRMLKEWREDFTSGKLTLAMIEKAIQGHGWCYVAEVDSDSQGYVFYGLPLTMA